MDEPSKVGALGLTSAEANQRLLSGGSNALPKAKREPFWRRVIRQFQSPIIYILIFALSFDLLLFIMEGGHGWPFEATAIAAILLFNTSMGVWQEYRAEDALAKLQALAASRAWVIRDGELQRIPVADVVPGDLARIEAGERIPADGKVTKSQSLLVDESTLTGESIPIDKAVDDDLLSGTLVVRGQGYFQITETGPASAMGKIATMIGDVKVDPTPLERRLDHFGNRVARWVGILAASLAVIIVAFDGFSAIGEAVLFGVALAVAAVPEGLPAVLTLTLALGTERMSKRKAIVRRLSAVEALGSVTVIATDKTGTLTENKMTVQKLDTPNPEQTLQALVLAADAEPDTDAGDPLEVGLYRFAESNGIDVVRTRNDNPRISERSFDSAWKYMRVTVQHNGEAVSYLKGAAEVLLPRCRLTAAEQTTWLAKIEQYASEGYRLIAFAAGPGETETDLEWLGIATIIDPPRPEVPQAIRQCQDAGIRVLMITGDHPATAAAIADQIGIDAESVITGNQIDEMTTNQLAEAVKNTSVFARVSPAHKLALVDSIKANDEVCAMTGDGVNDAPALKRADVGVAMGQRGSDVTREVADLVLLDDNFATIVAAVEEGRSIYENILKFIRFLFSTNVALVLLVVVGMLGAAALGLRDSFGALLVPLTAAQLLWINVIADGPPALALAFDRNPNVMSQTPRPAKAPLLDRISLRFILIIGAFKAAIGLALLGILPLMGHDAATTRSAVFLYEALAQLILVYPARSLTTKPETNKILNYIVGISIAAQILILLIPGTRLILNLEPLGLQAWITVAVAVAVTWAIGATAFLWKGRPDSAAS
jgi:Ca2+-transporting ATPase